MVKMKKHSVRHSIAMPLECKHVTFITSVKMIILILAVCSLGQSEVNVDCIWNSDKETTLFKFLFQNFLQS